jgi:NAD(P)H-flavin reductase
LSKITFAGSAYQGGAGESVLDVLLRQGAEIPYSCRKGTCLTCMLVATDGDIPDAANGILKPTERALGLFLACQCPADRDIGAELPSRATIYGRATVRGKERVAPDVTLVRIRPANDVYYHAGQFINLQRSDGLTRSYSLASVPTLDQDLELHVRRLPGGAMSGWICDTLSVGDELDIQGPLGSSFYLPGQSDRNMLLIGTGTGLAPLYGIARDALVSGHRGAIVLYHGSREPDGIYLREELRRLSDQHVAFSYFPCVSGDSVPQDFRAGRADELALADHPKLDDWLVYLCGYPPMVHAAKKMAFLAGASLEDIHTDPFDLKDLRAEPREGEAERPDVW